MKTDGGLDWGVVTALADVMLLSLISRQQWIETKTGPSRRTRWLWGE